jgi:pimeloyl-ACP methyl ester carboxylesterase
MQYFKLAFIGCVLFVAVINEAAWSSQDVTTELVRLQTSDGIVLTGVLRQHHVNTNNTGVILVHGYSGNFYSGIMSFLPETLADRGFATLSVNMRDHDHNPKKNLFSENRLDIAAAVEAMSRRGFCFLFLHGHSMGTNRVLYYLAKTHDARITGLILTGPPGNLFNWNVTMFGKEAAASVLRQAQNLVTDGKGDQWLLVDLGPLGKALYTADHLVSLRAPTSVSDPFKNITRISTPILIVHGLSDRLADPAVAEQLGKNAASASSVSVVKIPGAGHRFLGRQVNLTDVISRWIKQQTKSCRDFMKRDAVDPKAKGIPAVNMSD